MPQGDAVAKYGPTGAWSARLSGARCRRSRAPFAQSETRLSRTVIGMRGSSGVHGCGAPACLGLADRARLGGVHGRCVGRWLHTVTDSGLRSLFISLGFVALVALYRGFMYVRRKRRGSASGPRTTMPTPSWLQPLVHLDRRLLRQHPADARIFRHRRRWLGFGLVIPVAIIFTVMESGREGALISIPLWALYVASFIGYVVIQRKRYKP